MCVCVDAQIQDLGSGANCVCRLMQDLHTGELVAIKFVPRGPKVRCVMCNDGALLDCVTAATI